MRAVAVLAIAALLLGCRSDPPAFSNGRIVDLTWAFGEETIYWPTEEGFAHEREFAGRTDAGYYYSAYRFRSAEHGGTHVDAPVHFNEQGRSLDEIPVEDLVGPGIVVDVSAACARDRDHRVSVAELEAWEDRFGRMPDRAIVLLRTGFGRFWPDRTRYMGTDQRGGEGVDALRFPGLHAEAARWLVEMRSVRAVGLDTPSIDHGPSKDFASHRVLAGAQVPIFENVANLERLPARGFQVIALPMKIRAGSGGPLRIVAFLRKNLQTGR
jgi:kynurenine formamidase